MEWMLVYTAEGPSEAIVIRSVLESAGIKVKEVKETRKLHTISMDGLGKIDIYVPADKFDEAKLLLEDIEE